MMNNKHRLIYKICNIPDENFEYRGESWGKAKYFLAVNGLQINFYIKDNILEVLSSEKRMSLTFTGIDVEVKLASLDNFQATRIDSQHQSDYIDTYNDICNAGY